MIDESAASGAHSRAEFAALAEIAAGRQERYRRMNPDERPIMYFGGSIFLIALGAILSFAVTDSINGVDLVTVGYILMAAGALGIVLSFLIASNARGRDVHGRDPQPPVR